MKNIIILISLSILIVSCQKKEEIDNTKIEVNDANKEIEGFSMNQITTNYDTLIKRVKNEGNEDAYDELFYGFMDSNKAERTDSVMIYSKIMANKFNYERAYFDYLDAFCEKNDIEIDFTDYSKIDISKLNKNTKKEVTDWFKNMVKEKIITKEQYDSIKKK
jgi:hypothetical protein